MPSLSNATPKQWAQIYASTRVSTYEILDMLRNGPVRTDALTARLREHFGELVRTGWISVSDEDVITLTEEGRRHLASF